MKTILAALALILTVSAHAQSWERIEGQHSGVKETMAVAVQDSGKWAEIWRRHNASAPAPVVDFSKENVIVVFLGQTQTAGVKVQLVVQQDPIDTNRVNVFYRQTAANKGFAAQVQCEPFAMVKIPRAALIHVETDAVVTIPELIVGLMGASLPGSIADVLSIPSALAALRTSLAPGTVDLWRALRALVALSFVVAFAMFLVRRDTILVDSPEDGT